jgi:hypothetical protein
MMNHAMIVKGMGRCFALVVLSITSACEDAPSSALENCTQSQPYVRDAGSDIVFRACALPSVGAATAVNILVGFENRTDNALCMVASYDLHGQMIVNVRTPDGATLSHQTYWEPVEREEESSCAYGALPPRGFVGQVLDLTCSGPESVVGVSDCSPYYSFENGRYRLEILPPPVRACRAPCRGGQGEEYVVTFPSTDLEMEVVRE